jgi:acyl dehydratase
MPTDTHEADLAPAISDEALEEAREMNRVELDTNELGVRRRHNWNVEATFDNIRHFARGYGDDNPLYTDRAYAENTRWGRLVAPPTFLYTIDTAIIAPKLPGVQWIYGGTKFEFERPVMEDDVFTVSVKQTGIERIEGTTAGDMALQTGEVEYFDQHDELVATGTGRTMRIPRPGPSGASDDSDGTEGIQQNRDLKEWTKEDLMDLEDDILDQTRRGDETRYWDTVSVGDELEPRVKGPLSLTDIICWYMGTGSPIYFPHELFVKERLRHPSEAFRREDMGFYEHPAMGHVDPSVAAGIGVPRAYDIGPQRITWLTQVVTDWKGDDGFLKEIDVRLNGLNYVGEVSYCHGEVSDTYVDEETDEHLVDIDLWAENQDGDRIATGGSTVELPVS